MSVEVGRKAPDFTLMNQDRQPVTLSAVLQKGPVVLAFFPAAFSSVCRTRCARSAIRSLRWRLERRRCSAISTDTFFTLKAWADQQRFSFPLLSDYNKDVIRSYGVVNPDMIGLKNIAKRAVFVIGGDGTSGTRGAGRRAERAGLRQGTRGAHAVNGRAQTGSSSSCQFKGDWPAIAAEAAFELATGNRELRCRSAPVYNLNI